jgi:hypothetical protein
MLTRLITYDHDQFLFSLSSQGRPTLALLQWWRFLGIAQNAKDLQDWDVDLNLLSTIQSALFLHPTRPAIISLEPWPFAFFVRSIGPHHLVFSLEKHCWDHQYSSQNLTKEIESKQHHCVLNFLSWWMWCKLDSSLIGTIVERRHQIWTSW